MNKYSRGSVCLSLALEKPNKGWGTYKSDNATKFSYENLFGSIEEKADKND